MIIKIDKDLPIPEGGKMKAGAGRNAKYPFAAMQPRDSFLMPAEVTIKQAYQLVYYWNKRRDGEAREYTFREVGDRIRVWRVK